MADFHDSEICRTILETLQAGVCVLDLQGKIVFWSDGAERITGFRRHEVVGHPSTANILERCNQKKCESCGEACPLSSAMHSARPAEAACWLHHKAGHKIAVRLRSAPVRDSHGSIMGVAGDFEEGQIAGIDHHEDGLKAPGCVDEITGVASHLLMQSHLRETLSTFTELNVPFGILTVRLQGLDHFRASNGQEAASALLRAVARSLETALWRTDFVGRWSEDQFLVVVNGCSEHALHSVGERIHGMASSGDIEWWGERRSLPVCIGEASAQINDTVESLLARAEQSQKRHAAQHNSPQESLARGAGGS
jgi:PAS domain S-box-containing protein/diguanylate cyclase (GGDEF)-like protein